jgi:hypothetical protein
MTLGDRENNLIRHDRNWAIARLVLGIAQMCGAGAAVTMLVVVGVNAYSLATVALNSILTTVSILLFGGRRKQL